MTADHWHNDIGRLLATCRIGSLATSGKHGPEASMAPFAMDTQGLLLHLSNLARHTVNLKVNPHAGFMICTPEQTSASPLSLPRLSLEGSVVPVDASEVENEKSCYLARIAEAEPLFSFADFRLYRFEIARMYWVGGFGSARTVSADSWNDIFHAIGQKDMR